MSHILFPKAWSFFIDELVPDQGRGYKDGYLLDKFEAFIAQLLDEDRMNMDDDDIAWVIGLNIVYAPILDSDSDEIRESCKTVVNQTFGDIFRNEIVVHRSEYLELKKNG
jgi:hypothetical protein